MAKYAFEMELNRAHFDSSAIKRWAFLYMRFDELVNPLLCDLIWYKGLGALNACSDALH